MRQLRRRPGFALVAVLTLAIGIGANTAIFSAADQVLLRQLPYVDVDQVVRVFETDRRTGQVSEERGFQESLEIDGAIVTIGAERPDQFGDFFGAADTGTIAPLIRVDRNQPYVQAAQLNHDLIFTLNEPVDLGSRKRPTQLCH